MAAQIQEETQKIQGFRSLKVGLIVAFLATSTVTLAVIGVLELFFSFTILKQAGSSQQQLVAQEAAGAVESSIQEKFRILETGVKLGSLATASRDQRQLMLDKLLGLEPAFRQVVLLDTEDKELERVSRLSAGASTLFTNQLTPDILTGIHKSEEYIGSVYVDNLNNEPMMVVAVPNTDVLGNYQGALVAELNLKFMWDLVDHIRVGQKGQAYVVDKKGNLLAYTDVGRVIAGENLSKLEGVHGFINGKEETSNLAGISKGIQNTFVVSKYIALNAPDWAVVVELPAVEAYQNTIQMIELLVFVVIIGFVFATISGVILSGRISRPIIDLRNAAAELSTGKLTTRIEINSQDEIGQLAQAFNQMAQRLSAYTGELEQKIKERTAELSIKLKELEESNKTSGEAKLAMLNLLEDEKALEGELKIEKASVEQKVIERTAQLQKANEEINKGWFQLQQERAKLVGAINNVTDAFILADTEGNIVLHNNVLSTIFSPNVTAWTFSSLKKFLGTGLDITAYYEKCMLSRKPIYFKEVMVGPKYLRVYLAPVLLKDGGDKLVGVVITISDITEERVLQRSRDEFFSIASHELRTPLTAIKGNASLIKQFYAKALTDPDLAEMINDIEESSTRLIDIVNDFLNMGRLEQNKIEFKLEPFDLTSLVDSSLRQYQVTGSRKKLSLTFAKPIEQLPMVRGDMDRTRQTLINLIGNALKFTEVGGVTVTLRQDNGFVTVLVADTGRGIPVANQSLLFRKFQQAGSSLYTRDTTKGTGLGLYISKLMVEGMGGKIWLESSLEGKGSTFAFSLPIATSKVT